MISLAFVIGSIVTAILILGGVGLILWGVSLRRRDYDEWVLILPSGIVAIVLTLGIAAFAFFPYDMQYHRYKPVSGTVTQVDKRLLSDGNGSTQNYAVRLAGQPTVYRCDDTRCSLLKPGDPLKLWCIREWEYASESGWVCRYGQAG